MRNGNTCPLFVIAFSKRGELKLIHSVIDARLNLSLRELSRILLTSIISTILLFFFSFFRDKDFWNTEPAALRRAFVNYAIP